MVRVSVRSDGQLILPAPMPRSLGVEAGGEVMAEIVNGEVRLTSRDASLDRARALFRRYVPAGTPVVEELIAERRAEGAVED